MGFRDFFKKPTPSVKPPAPAPISPLSPAQPNVPTQPAANPGTTQIEREHFSIHAPFQWVAVPSDNPLEFEFRNKTLPEQLIVTVLLGREAIDSAKAQAFAKDLADKRLNALAKISNGRAVHAPLRFQSGSGQSEARSVGHDEPQKVRFAFVVRVAPTKVVTVALTRYFLEEIGSPFEVYSGLIFDFLQIKNPGLPAGT